jgi:hypothetical protein
MAFNTQDTSVQYIIDKDKRTIVAILNVSATKIATEVRNIITKRSSNYFTVIGVIPSNKLLLSGKYVGKAKAHPDDKWDENKGKEIALLRAQKAYMTERAKIMRGLEDVFDDIEDNVKKAGDCAFNAIKAINRKLKA